MTNFEKREKLLKEVISISDNNYPRLFGSASVFLTVKQLEIMKTVLEKNK
jgi:hypothetical protein